MGMTDQEHQVEGQLLIQTRMIIVAIAHALRGRFVQHQMTEKELLNRMRGLRDALLRYENMMEERDE